MINKNKSKKINQLEKQILKLVDQYSKLKFSCNAISKNITVPVSGKVIGSDELKFMTQSSLDAWLTTGKFNKLFQESISKFTGIKHVLTVNSGSSANLVAFNSLTAPELGSRAIKKNDEVITVAAGFPTTVNPIIQFGAIPVFVDIEPTTLNIDATRIVSAITKKTKAIVIAHALGNPFDIKKIKYICKKFNLWLIEDCCDALGSTFNNTHVGNFGDIATLSFYPAHHITTGEGGAVMTNNSELARIAESIRDWGRDCYCEPGVDNTCGKRFCWKLGKLPFGYDHKYIYSNLGYNLKITDMQAACGLAQMNKVSHFVKKRKKNFLYLKNKLSHLTHKLSFAANLKNTDPSWFGFPITLKKNLGYSRVDFLSYLNDHNIGTRLLFAGNLTKQPYMQNQNYKIHGNLKNTDNVMNNTFWIGVYPGLSNIHLNYVIKKINNFHGINF